MQTIVNVTNTAQLISALQMTGNVTIRVAAGTYNIDASVTSTINISGLKVIEAVGAVVIDGTDFLSDTSGTLHGTPFLTVNNADLVLLGEGLEFRNFNGGVIDVRTGTLDVYGTTFNNNDVSGSGGAIDADTSFVRVTDATFVGNDASNSGGAISSNAGLLQVFTSTFDGNSALNGGAIRFDGSELIIAGAQRTEVRTDFEAVTFTNNRASNLGGAVFINAYESTFARINLPTRVVDGVTTSTNQAGNDHLGVFNNIVGEQIRPANIVESPLGTFDNIDSNGNPQSINTSLRTPTSPLIFINNSAFTGVGPLNSLFAGTFAGTTRVTETGTDLERTVTATGTIFRENVAAGSYIYFTVSGTAVHGQDFIFVDNPATTGVVETVEAFTDAIGTQNLFRYQSTSATRDASVTFRVLNDSSIETDETILIDFVNPTMLDIANVTTAGPNGAGFPIGPAYVLADTIYNTFSYVIDANPPRVSFFAYPDELATYPNGAGGAALSARFGDEDGTIEIDIELPAGQELNVDIRVAYELIFLPADSTLLQSTLAARSFLSAATAEDVDVTSVTGFIDILAGERTGTLTIDTADDFLPEGLEAFVVRLRPDTVNTSPTYALGADGLSPFIDQLVFIEDDGDIGARVLVEAITNNGSATYDEGFAGPLFRVSLVDLVNASQAVVAGTGGFEITITATGTAQDARGGTLALPFAPFERTVTIAAGQSSVIVDGDLLADLRILRNSELTLTATETGSAGGITLFSWDDHPASDSSVDNVATVSVRDTTPTQTWFTLSGTEVSEAGTSVFVDVALQALPFDDVAIVFKTAGFGSQLRVERVSTSDVNLDSFVASTLGTSGGITGPSDYVYIGIDASAAGTSAPAARRFRITGLDDALVDGNALYSLLDNVEILAVDGDSNFRTFGSGTLTNTFRFFDSQGVEFDGPPSITVFDNDGPQVRVSAVTGTAAEGSSGVAQYTLSLNTTPAEPVTVGLSFDNSIEVSLDNSTFVSVAAVTLTDTSPTTIFVRAKNDDIARGNRDVVISHAVIDGDDAAYTPSLAIPSARVAVTDNDAFVVSLVNFRNGSEESPGINPASFGIALNAPAPAGGLTVTLLVRADGQSGRATSGTDFTAIATTVRIEAGQTGVNVDVRPIVDDFDEGVGERVEIELVPVGGSYTVSPTAGAGQFTITDDDVAGIRIVESQAATRLEEGGTDTYTVQLTSRPTQNVTVAIVAPTGLTSSVSQLVFTPDNWFTARTVTLTATDDQVAQQPTQRTLTVTHSVTSGDADYQGIAAANIQATVIDNDIGGIQLTTSSNLDVSENGGRTATFTFAIFGAPQSPVRIDFDFQALGHPTDGIQITDDFGNVLDSITLSGNTISDRFARVHVVAIDDAIDFDARQTTVNFDVSSADALFDAVTLVPQTITINDDDVAGVLVEAIDNGFAVEEDGDGGSFQVRLNSQPRQGPVHIDLRSSGTGNRELGFSTSRLTFTTDNWDDWQRVDIVAANNDFVDSDVRTQDIEFVVVATTPEYAPLIVDRQSVSIAEDDVAGITVDVPDEGLLVTASGTTDSFTITFDSQPTTAIRIQFDVPDYITAIPDVIFDPETNDFGPGEFSKTVTVNLSVIDGADVPYGLNQIDIIWTASGADPNFDGRTDSVSVSVDSFDRDALADGLSALFDQFDDTLAQLLDFDLGFFNPGEALPTLFVSFSESVEDIVRSAVVRTLDQLADLVEVAIEDGLSAIGLGLDPDTINVEITGAIDDETGAEILFDLSISDSFGTDLDFSTDFGLPELGASIEGIVETSFGYDIGLAFGVSEDLGFFVETGADSTGIVLDLNASFADGFAATGDFGFLGLSVTDNEDPGDRTRAFAEFGIGVGSEPGRWQPFDDDAPDFVDQLDVSFDSGVTLRLDAEVALGGSTVFPGVTFGLDGDWNGFSLTDGEVSLDTSPTLALTDIEIDAGSFISEFANPLLIRVDEIVDPFRPILELLTAEIEVLDFLGFTGNSSNIAGLISAVSGGRVNIKPFTDDLIELSNLVAAAADAARDGANFVIEFGDYELVGDDGDIGSEPRPDELDADEVTANAGGNGRSSSFLRALSESVTYTFPILTDPAELIGLLLGEDSASLFEARLDPLVLEGGFSRGFSIFEVLDGSLGGNATVGVDLGFGFDTKGLEDWAATDFALDQSWRIFDGFFVSDLKDGEDIAELTASLDFGASVSVDLFLASGSLSAGIRGNVAIDFRDTGEAFGVGDGKIRAISEIGANITQPWNLFNLVGSIRAYARAYAEVFGATLVDTSFETELVSIAYGAEGFSIATAFDGPIDGAVAFFDADFDGVQDADEPYTLTGVDPASPTGGTFDLAIPLEIYDHNGNGVIDPNEGRIIVTGGFDTDLNAAQQVPLILLPGWTVASPLTLLAAELAAIDPAAAAAAVNAAFGLPAALDLRTTDILAQTLAGDTDAAAALALVGQLQTLIILGANSFGPEIVPSPEALASGQPTIPENAPRADGAIAIIVALADRVKAGLSIDLSNAVEVRAILETAAQAVNVTPTALTEVVTDIAARNAAIGAVTGAGTAARDAIVAQVPLDVADSVYGFSLENVITRIIVNATEVPDLAATLAELSEALGLGAATNLTTYNPFEAVETGDTDAAAVLAAQAQVNATLVQVAAFTGGSTGEGTEAATLDALLALFAGSDDVDLTDPDVIAGLVLAIDPSLDPDVLAAGANAIAEQNVEIESLAQDAADGGDLDALRGGVADIQRFAQGSQATNLVELGSGDITPEGFEQARAAAQSAETESRTIRIDTDEDTTVTDETLPIAAAASGQDFLVTAVNGVSVTFGQAIVLDSGALLTVDADGNLTYDSNEAFSDDNSVVSFVDTATVTISTNTGSVDTALIVTVETVNDAPVGIADVGMVSEDGQVTVDVIVNDTDLEDDTLQVTAVGNAEFGVVTLTDSGELLYAPAGAFEALAVGEVGTDRVTYTLSDGNGGTATATLVISVTGSNDGPSAEDDNRTTTEAALLSAIAVLSNDRDIDTSDVLSVIDVLTSGTAGNAGLNADGTLFYDPDGAFEFLAVGETATDSFGYAISDGNGGSDIGTVTITITGVNDAPTVGADARATSEDSAISIVDALGNDADVDRTDVLRILSVDTAGTRGSVTINADGTLRYDPNRQFESLSEGEFAIDRFRYTISDGNGGTATGEVTVTVNGAEDVGFDGLFIFGSTAANTITGTPDIDVVFGDSGDDSLNGGNQADVLSGGAGNDTLNGANGHDVLYGNEGADRIIGGNGGDIIFGSGARTVAPFGGPALVGDAAADTLSGGQGLDRFYVLDGDGADTITDFVTGQDTIVFLNTAVRSFAQLAISTTQAGTLVDFGGGTVLLSGVGIGAFTSASVRFEPVESGASVFGTSNDDLLVGSEGADELFGGAGDDVLFGDAPEFISG